MLMFLFGSTYFLVLGCLSVVFGLGGIVFFLAKLGEEDLKDWTTEAVIQWLVMSVFLFIFGPFVGMLLLLVISLFQALFGAPKLIKKLWISSRELPQKFPAAWQKIKAHFGESMKKPII